MSAPPAEGRALPIADRAALVFGSIFLVLLPVPHTNAARLFCLGALALLALRVLRRETIPRVPATLAIAIAVWLIASMLSLSRAIDLEYSLGELRSEILYGLATFGTFFVLARNWRTVLAWRNALLVSVTVLGVLAVCWRIALPEEFHKGPYGGAGTYVTFVVLAMPLLTWAVMRAAHGALPNWAVATVGIVLIAGAAATLNRVIWLVAPIQVILFGILAWRATRASGETDRRRIYTLGVGALLLTAASGWMVVQMQDERRATGTATFVTPEGERVPEVRIELWRHSLGRIAEAPLTGYGFGRGTMRRDFVDRYHDPLLWHAHNVFLNYGLQLGIMGPLVLLLLMASIVWAYVRLSRSGSLDTRLQCIVGLTLVIGFVLRSYVDDFFYRHNALAFWALNGMLLGWGARLAREPDRDDALGA